MANWRETFAKLLFVAIAVSNLHLIYRHLIEVPSDPPDSIDSLHPSERKTLVERMISEKFGPELAPMALAISKAENSRRECDIDNAGLNRNNTIDIGVFQLNSVHAERFRGYDFRNCADNIEVAYQLVINELSKGRNPWKLWSVYQNKRYKKYLPHYMASR